MWDIDKRLILAGVAVAALTAATNFGFGIYDRVNRTSIPTVIQSDFRCDDIGLSILAGALGGVYRGQTGRRLDPELSLEAAKAACFGFPTNPSPKLEEALDTLSTAFDISARFTPEKSRLFVEETSRNLADLSRSSPQVEERLSATNEGLEELTSNFVDSTLNLPSLVSDAAYASGILFGVMGVLELKDHVENPSQTPLNDGAVRLGADGALFALPLLYEVLIENQTGVATQVIQLRDLDTSRTVDE